MPRINSSTWSTNDAITGTRLQDFNEDLDDLYSKGTDRGRVVTAASLTALRIDIGAFAWRVGSTSGQYAGGTDIVAAFAAADQADLDAITGRIDALEKEADGLRGIARALDIGTPVRLLAARSSASRSPLLPVACAMLNA